MRTEEDTVNARSGPPSNRREPLVDLVDHRLRDLIAIDRCLVGDDKDREVQARKGDQCVYCAGYQPEFAPALDVIGTVFVEDTVTIEEDGWLTHLATIPSHKNSADMRYVQVRSAYRVVSVPKSWFVNGSVTFRSFGSPGRSKDSDTIDVTALSAPSHIATSQVSQSGPILHT
jgi:hypothetical protein